MKITLVDVRALQYCNSGVREFCKKHGIDYSLFIKNGINANELQATNDAMAVALIEHAKQREANCE